MALLKFEFDFELDALNNLANQFPDISGGLLSFIGSRARGILYNKYLSGQDLTLTKYPKNTRGAFTVVSDVNKKQDRVKIYSPVVQLFDQPHRLRSGAMSQGTYTITRKLKQDVLMGLAGYAKEYEDRFLQKALDKI